jgi:glycosyltransferase involved in cell wall biosynthesis
MKIAIIFDNFGPYHLARLGAAAQVCELMAMEVATSSAEYAWKREAQGGGQKPDAGGRRTEVSGQQGTSNIEHPTSNIQTAESAECGAQSGEPEDGGRRTEGRRQKTEDGAESRKQKTENKKEFQLSAFSVSAFKNVTLLERGTSREVSHRELAARLNRALDDFRPQVVFIPGWSSRAAFAALNWCARNNIPAVAMSESTEWDETRASWKEWVKRKLVGLCATALVGGSSHKDYLMKLGMPPERIFFGYDAVDNDYFAQSAREARSAECGVRSKYGLPGHYFLASARFIEKKNLPRLLKAYARYRELAEKTESGKHPPTQSYGTTGKVEMGNEEAKSRKQKTENKNEFQLSAFQISACNNVCPPTFLVREMASPISQGSPTTSDLWSLVLLGDGPLRPTLNLHAHVQMPGFKQYPDLPAYYALAGAFIHASTTEQWGLVVNEAMASGLPVLVSNRCGCAPDLVKDGMNGFTFDPYNVEQLAQLMLKISAFNFPLSDFGVASQRIIANWGPERFASGLKAAAEMALKVGPVKPSIVQRLVLKALLIR